MKLIEVNSRAIIKEFNKVPYLIYNNDPNWIPYLKQDVEAIFDKKTNKYFGHGKATRWILKDHNGKLIGRVAAFINKKLSNTFKQPTGGIGFFECIDNQEAANFIFDNCRKWLQERGMEAMDGPVNFGEKDKFWGLITENFNLPPYYGQNYNPEYYVKLFENFGFKIYYNQLVYHRAVGDPLQDKYREKAERIAENPKYKITNIDKKQLNKYAEDFREVYNRAWLTHDNFKGMSKSQALAIINKIKPIIDEDLIYFAYYEGKPISFYISLPEINEILRFVNGNLNWWGKIKFVWYRKMGVCKNSFGVAFGVVPDHQGKGVEGAIFNALAERLQAANKYSNIIIGWIGDFNPKMIHITEGLGVKMIRKMATYRKLFDENAVFERAPIID